MFLFSYDQRSCTYHTNSGSDIYIGRGHSTPTQTAWAILPLIEAGYANTPVVHRAVRYLLKQFESEGQLNDLAVVGTGFVGKMYLHYPSYPYAFPLIAITEYKKSMQQLGIFKLSD
ncbi:MAG: hypothetical protein HOM11_15315 [Methylococcales bacterium]|nr:hypothetical protein [Methylococcales bacterium]MBT7443113.1 hypothetical protein [Methylococcales bacterium]